MFAALVTEAGPLDVPRAEAFATDRKHFYTFSWKNFPFHVSKGTVVFSRLYATREGDSDLGMLEILIECDEINVGDNVSMIWELIHTPLKAKEE